MRISELIKVLQEIKKREGDLRCKVKSEYWTFSAAVLVERPDEYSEKQVVIQGDW